MGARDLLRNLAASGITVSMDGCRLIVQPASKLTDEARVALRSSKAELLALLATLQPRPNSPALPAAADTGPGARYEAEPGHEAERTPAEIETFTARVSLFRRRGLPVEGAEALAARLALRDRNGEERRVCFECRHLRGGRCSNPRAAMLRSSEVGRDLAALLQRCAGYASSPL